MNPAKVVGHYTSVQNHKAVPAYFTSEQTLPFGFTEQCRPNTLKSGYKTLRVTDCQGKRHLLNNYKHNKHAKQWIKRLTL